MTISRNAFLATLAAITAVRLVLIAWIPVKNDEAYYILWAQHLASGYYDHPPLVAWLIWLMSHVSDSVAWFRLVAIGSILLATWVVYRLALPLGGVDRARLAALLFALSPSGIWMVFISNDPPLLIFGLLSVLAFIKALERTDWRWALGSGALLGLAFLTKYLAVLIGFGYLVYALQQQRKQRLTLVAWVVAGAAPFILQHVYYNATHAWETVNFHLSVRNAGKGFEPANVIGYLLSIALVMTPWGVWALVQMRARLRAADVRLPVTLTLVALAMFLLVSLTSVVGLHFFLLIAPFVFALYALIDQLGSQRRILGLSAGYGVLLAGILFAALLMPLERLAGWKEHSNFVVGLAPADVCKPLAKYRNMPLFATYYAQAGILSYTCDQPIQVLFSLSSYGRQMDRWLDARELDGKQLAIFVQDAVFEQGISNHPVYGKYFTSYTVDSFRVHGAPFAVVVGKGFNYELYRRDYLKQMRERFHRPPAWLPTFGKRDSYFAERYFPEGK